MTSPWEILHQRLLQGLLQTLHLFLQNWVTFSRRDGRPGSTLRRDYTWRLPPNPLPLDVITGTLSDGVESLSRTSRRWAPSWLKAPSPPEGGWRARFRDAIQ